MDDLLEFEHFICVKYNKDEICAMKKSIVCGLIDEFIEHKAKDVLVATEDGGKNV